jgi:hypothetical protein
MFGTHDFVFLQLEYELFSVETSHSFNQKVPTLFEIYKLIPLRYIDSYLRRTMRLLWYHCDIYKVVTTSKNSKN